MKTKLQIVFLCFFVFTATAFAQQEARKFDEMGQVNCEDAKARLDNLAIQLQQEPTMKGYIIFYGGKSYLSNIYNRRTKRYVEVKLLPRRGEAKARMTPWIDYLTNSRGIEASRIEVIDGGYREEPMMEFWIAPSGVKPPRGTPTLTEKEIKFRKGRVKGREIRCEV
ncbi:MAG: hypothetical protein QOH25_1356 [Acidobacteriota bacterium]|jgi:hypothetical protein|nr:hypothetical protein [Acidobacteriota bacterium]